MEPCLRSSCTTSCTETFWTASRRICPERRYALTPTLSCAASLLFRDHVTSVFQICWSASAGGSVYGLLRSSVYSGQTASALLLFFIFLYPLYLFLTRLLVRINIRTENVLCMVAAASTNNKMKLLRHVVVVCFSWVTRDRLNTGFIHANIQLSFQTQQNDVDLLFTVINANADMTLVEFKCWL